MVLPTGMSPGFGRQAVEWWARCNRRDRAFRSVAPRVVSPGAGVPQAVRPSLARARALMRLGPIAIPRSSNFSSTPPWGRCDAVTKWMKSSVDRAKESHALRAATWCAACCSSQVPDHARRAKSFCARSACLGPEASRCAGATARPDSAMVHQARLFLDVSRRRSRPHRIHGTGSASADPKLVVLALPLSGHAVEPSYDFTIEPAGAK